MIKLQTSCDTPTQVETPPVSACELNEIEQYLTVQALRDLSHPRCPVGVTAMDEDAHEDCQHDSDHGRGTVFIHREFLCRPCGLDVAEASMHLGGYVDVEVYR